LALTPVLPEAAVRVVALVPVVEVAQVQRLLAVLDEAQVVVRPQLLPAVQEGVVLPVAVAEGAVVAMPNTTRCRTSRSDRGASGRRALHRS
jgi:hypothetical protein